jgi:hypothetical protein
MAAVGGFGWHLPAMKQWDLSFAALEMVVSLGRLIYGRIGMDQASVTKSPDQELPGMSCPFSCKDLVEQ